MDKPDELVFLLSKKYIDLSVEEVVSLLAANGMNPKHRLIDNLIIAPDPHDIDFASRLGFTHSIYSLIFETTKEKLMSAVENYPWQSIYRENYCVRVHGTKEIDEIDLAKLIYHKLVEPKVKLVNSATKIDFFFRGDKVIAGLFEKNVDKSFEKRRAHLRPSVHPTSMHPGLARALINLSGLKNGLIIDPFCGSGGILIEASLMGFDTIGYDIDYVQIKRAKLNINHYHLKHCEVSEFDARRIGKKCDAIVTDFPYGKSSKAGNLTELYSTFLTKVEDCSNIAVVVFPHFVDYEEIISQTNWEVRGEFRIYVHKSLTRVIVKLALKK